MACLLAGCCLGVSATGAGGLLRQLCRAPRTAVGNGRVLGTVQDTVNRMILVFDVFVKKRRELSVHVFPIAKEYRAFKNQSTCILAYG